MKNSLLLLLTLTVRLAAQRPDLDDLSRGVDLSTLKPIDTPSPAGEPDTRPPHSHLFVDMDLLTP
ncbi:MAG: hypothetical protein PF795_07895, partial [Kiritimatiellae bacterium]|nr:hypothetical protein [Kiritimatiellia bacterium]